MKKFLIIFTTILCAVIIGITVFLLTFNIDRYRADVTTKLTMLLGRPVKIESMEMKLALVPTIHINHITILNPSQIPQNTPFAEIDEAHITLALAPLLSNRLEIQDISLGKMQMNVYRQKGQSNLNFLSHNEMINALNQKWLNQARVDSVSVREFVLSYQGERSFSIPMTDVSIKQLKVFSIQTEINGNAFKISGTLNDLKDLIVKKPDYAFNIEVSGAEMDMKLNGTVGDTQEFKKVLLNTEISGKNLKRTLELFNIKGKQYPNIKFDVSATIFGDLTQGEIQKLIWTLDKDKLESSWTGTYNQVDSRFKVEGKGSIRLADWTLGQLWNLRSMTATMDLSVDPTELNFKNIAIQAERTDVQLLGKINWQQEKPVLQFQIGSEYLDIQDIFLGDMTYANTVPTGLPWQGLLEDKTPIDLTYLQKINGTIEFGLPHMKVVEGVDNYIGAFGKIVLENGVVTANPLSLNLLNGTVTAGIQMDLKDNHLHIQLNGQNLDLNMLKDISYLIQGGIFDTTLTMDTFGKTAGEWINNLNAQVMIELSKGRIVSTWFSDMVDALFVDNKHSVSYTTADRESKVRCGVIQLNIQNGQIVPDKSQMVLEASRAAFHVLGGVDLVNGAMNLIIKAYALGEQMTSIPDIRVLGTIMEPEVRLDSEISDPQQIEYTPYLLCQSILGHKTKTQMEEEAQQQLMLPLPTVIDNDNNQENASFSQQLLETIKNRK